MNTEGEAEASSSQPEAIHNFVSITGSTAQHAKFCLEACGGNMDSALSLFYSTEANAGGQPDPPIQGTQGYTAARRPATQDVDQDRGNRGFFGGALGLARNIARLPLFVIRTSFGIVGGVVEYGVGLASIFLPQRLRDAYEQTNAEMDPVRQARELALEFESQFGTVHPNFVEIAWKDAAAQAHRECKFLWVYMHAPDHEDTDSFCRDVLCSSEVVDFLNHNFVCWGGDVRRSQAFGLSARLGVTGFPFMCLLAYSGARLQLVTSVEGRLSQREVIQVLQQAMDDQGALMVAERVEREQREADRRLVEEQNREFAEASRKDMESERIRQREEQAKQEREAAKKEQLRKKKQEEEAAIQRKAEQEAAVEARKHEKRNLLKPEPTAGPGVSELRIKLPDGSTHNRRFYSTEQIQEVYNFVDSLDNLTCMDYTLVIGFPRLLLGKDKLHMNLEMVGLVPGGMIMVQSHDD